MDGVVDDVVVVDSGSSDDTLKIAQSRGARVIEPGWLGYGANKNLGNNYATNNWIINLDADEWLSPQLREEIKSLNLDRNRIYALDRKNLYNGKIIKYGGWSDDWVYRIFDKRIAQWNNSLVHEKLEFAREVSVTKLTHALMHESYTSVQDHVEKTKRYAMLKAKAMVDAGTPPSLMKRYLGSYFNALQSYLLQLGFLEGANGVTIAKMKSLYSREQIVQYDRMINKMEK